MGFCGLDQHLPKKFPLCSFASRDSFSYFDGGGFAFPMVCLGDDENVFVTSVPGVCESQNWKLGPYYGSILTKKC